MMRLWMTSYARPAPSVHAGVVSILAHAALIAGCVVATLPASSLPPETLTNRVYYIPPIERPSQARGSREVVHYITLAPGLGLGPGPSTIDVRRPVAPVEHSVDPGEQKVDSTPAVVPPPIGEKTGDSVFTILEVDTAVVRSERSAAPAYPLELLSKNIQGSVLARYVVDTTGFADTASFEVIRATNKEFIRAVRDALPYMRFSPAKIGPNKVRQLVEQPFTFRISPAMATAPKP